MTPEQLQELSEKAKLWDELSPLLKTIHGSKFERPSNGIITIENTSNASTFIDVLKEEMVELSKDGIIDNNVKTFVYEEFSEGLCSCGNKKFGHFSRCQSCLDIYSGHSGKGNF